MQYKAVIFDLDGTLVNSLEDIADSMNSILEINNFPVHNIQTYKQFIGSGLKNLVQMALPEEHKDKKSVTLYLNAMFELYSKNCTNKTKPYDGILDLLQHLASNNIKLSVLSNKADKLCKKTVKDLFPALSFEFVIGLTDETYKKPNPLVALKICQDLKIAPQDVLFVGDSGIDMQTAVNANMYAVGALWGFRTKEELHSNGAMHLIKRPDELIEIL